MTAKKKVALYKSMSPDTHHGHGSPSDLTGSGPGHQGAMDSGLGVPAAQASLVGMVATSAAAGATSHPGAVANAVTAVAGHHAPPPPPPSATLTAAVTSPPSALKTAAVKAPTAPTTTDSINKVYQHWADGDAATGSTAEWNNNILSANKSDYSEGEVIPHLFAFKASNNMPLVQGQSYSFNITYNYWQSNTNAGGFTGLTTFDISRHPNSWPVNGAPSGDSTFVNNGGTKGMFYT
ncbi:MAG: hypothetical protein FGM40_06805, partial [Rhodocyclaceae bacterium]|nr:hypothetical protein [Rhodocyclaceae bacterium]